MLPQQSLQTVTVQRAAGAAGQSSGCGSSPSTLGHGPLPGLVSQQAQAVEAGKDGGNSRNGTRSKTGLTDIGPVEIDVPRDREGSFAPAIVKKRLGYLNLIEFEEKHYADQAAAERT